GDDHPEDLRRAGAGRLPRQPAARRAVVGGSGSGKLTGRHLSPRPSPVNPMTPIYLDYNATTPLDPAVVEAMLPYLQTHFGNPSSTHPYGKTAHDAVERARQ